MMPESPIGPNPEPQPEILDYIRANRGTYTRAAIERELREAGHSQEAIDAAWRTFPVEDEATPLPTKRVIATAQFWALLLVVACTALAGLPLISVFAVSALTSLSAQTAMFDNGFAVFLAALIPILIGYLAIGLGGRWLSRRDRAAAAGVYGGLIVAFVLSVIVAGSCAAILTQL